MTTKTELSLEAINALHGEIEYDLEALNAMEATVRNEGRVDQITMEALARMVPDAIVKQHPIASYSKHPSEQNLDVSLEAFRIAKSIAVMSLGGVLGGVLRALVGLYKSDSLDTRCNHLLKLKEQLNARQADLKQWAKRAEAINESAKADVVVLLGDDVVAKRALLGKGDLKDSNAKTDALLALINPKGDVFKTFERWSKDVVKHSSLFSKRVRVVSEAIDKAYTARGSVVDTLVEKLNEIELSSYQKTFCQDMMTAEKAWCDAVGPNYEDNFAEFVKHELMDNTSFHRVANNYDAVVACGELFTKANVQLNRNMDNINEATLTLFGSPIPSQLKVGQVRNGEVQSLADADETVKVTKRALPVELLNAIRRADELLREEAEAFRCYRVYLERLVFFYQHVLIEYDTFSQEAVNYLKRLEMDAPVE